MSAPVIAILMISEEHERKLRRLNKIFLEENSKLNLSALRTEELSWIGNIVDSVSILESSLLSPDSKDLTVLDLGTGGGFPLLPLALCVPQCHFVGMDATQKKIAAVERIIANAGLTNASVVSGRAEELAHDPVHRERYDLVLCRAVAPINTLIELAAPFAKVGGYVILWKSLKIAKELTDSLLARAELSCHLIKQFEYSLPEDWGERQLLIFEKTFKSKENYPRSVGVPKKHPLL